MITALDRSVILDVLTADERFADRSERAIQEAAEHGELIIGECVLAEITPAFANRRELETFLSDCGISFVASTPSSVMAAGAMFKAYLNRGGKRGRIVADFLIAAHAQHHADQLIARDRGFLRDYFDELKVIDPSTSP